MARRAQFTILWLLLLGAVGLGAGLVAAAHGASADTAWVVGVGAGLAAELIFFGIPVTISSETGLSLPAAPDRVFAIATDPNLTARLSPIGLRLVESSGDAGQVGSKYVMTASGLRIAVRVLRSDPPHEIVIESRSRLNRAVVTRRYAPSDEGTEVWMRTEHRMPLGAWLLKPVFESEIRYSMAERQRRIRAYLEAANTSPQ
jgi:hypothetical protein